MRQICMSGSMSGVWKRSHGQTSEAPPDERGGNRYVRTTPPAPPPHSPQLARGEPQLGLPADFPGLRNVFRQGDPNAASSPSPVDFYSPDTFNYTVLNVAAT